MSGTVAIVGRPNVGKSTLFNRLVGRRVAMVDKTPGVTRDRREAEARLGDLEFRLVDTAGLGDAASGSLEARMRVQTERALEECSVVLFMIDARAGVTPLDRHFAGWLRRADVPVILIANKTESTRGDAGMLEAFELGLGEPVTISAEHGIGMGLLHAALAPHLRDGEIAADAVAAEEEGEADEEEPGPGAPLSLAIVGRPNVGKSTLINRLLGEERVLTGPEPGLTREAIAVTWSWGEHNIRLIDTAGLRRRARVTDRLEKMSSEDSLVAIRFAQVVVLLLDATDGLERQDLSIARHVADQGRALVVALNKWDLVADEAETLRRVRERLEDSLPQLRGVRLVTLSALTGRGIERLLPAVAETYEIWNRRVSTGPLNRWFEATLERHPPPVVQGRRVRLRYITQIKSRPPTFALFTTRPAALPESYLRYLVNALREAFDLPGVPLRIVTRKGRNPYVEGGSVPSKARRKDAGPRKPRAAI